MYSPSLGIWHCYRSIETGRSANIATDLRCVPDEDSIPFTSTSIRLLKQYELPGSSSYTTTVSSLQNNETTSIAYTIYNTAPTRYDGYDHDVIPPALNVSISISLYRCTGCGARHTTKLHTGKDVDSGCFYGRKRCST